MTPQLCNFEQSKALKALGYKGKTKHFFKNGLAEESYYEWDKNDHREWLCTRPTIQDAIRFFRVEKGIDCGVTINVNDLKFTGDYMFDVVKPNGKVESVGGYDSPDDAENALLNRMIEISNQEKA